MKDHHHIATFSFVLTIFLASLQFAPSRSLTLRLMSSSQIAFLPQNNPKSPLNLHDKPFCQSVAAFVLIQTPWTSHLRHQSRTTMEAYSFAQPANRKPRIAPPRKTPKSGYNRKILAIPAAHITNMNCKLNFVCHGY
ncbi:hypothetical protein V8G54_019046 [Vigna mungo]|uniref:Uncharacterized protein n=1 Tax=Vigna mungo TaxID=3915 RepID=A0AAQ3N995_VIGMU